MRLPRVVAVVGPTAAGKSELALDLAQALNGEVINTDAMQVYRGMDIGTAKLPMHERRGLTHHLLDFMEVEETASVAVFQGLARTAISQCHEARVTPVLVGGSALYTRAILDRLEFPGTDPQVRARLEAELEAVGAQALHQRLASLDASAAADIEPLNGRRIVRALEVIEITGGPFTATMPQHEYFYSGAVQFGVRVERAALDERIAQRVRYMWDAGLVEEVRGLEARLRDSRTASRAIGYAQVLALLAGEITEAEAIEKTIVATRRFVRRQDAWFLKDPRVAWLEGTDLVGQALSVLERAES